MDLLTRELYKRVKGMNKEEMSACLNHIFQKGVEAAEERSVSYDEVINTIKDLPGIGEKRLQQIAEALVPLYMRDNKPDGEASSADK